jgi:hypothetical protein
VSTTLSVTISADQPRRFVAPRQDEANAFGGNPVDGQFANRLVDHRPQLALQAKRRLAFARTRKRITCSCGTP